MINVKIKELLEAIKPLNKIIPSRSIIPIIENILFESKNDKLHLSATNMSTLMEVEIDCNFDGKSFLLPGKKIFDILKESDSENVEIKLNKKGDKCKIQTGEDIFNLLSTGSIDFPLFEKNGKISVEFDIESKVLQRLIDAVRFAAANEDSRFSISSICFDIKKDVLNIVATDSKILAHSELPFESLTECQFLLPQKEISSIIDFCNRAKNLHFSVYPNQIFIEANGELLSIRRIQDKFPPYDKVIENSMERSNDFELVIEKKLITKMFKKSLLFSVKDSLSVNIKAEDNKLMLYTSDPNSGESFLNLELSNKINKKFERLYNPTLIINALNAFEDEEVKIEFKDNMGPCVIKFKQGNCKYLYIIMPLSG